MSPHLLGAVLTSRADTSRIADSEWRRLVDRAIEERVAPALIHELRHEPHLPESSRERLLRELYRTGAFNLLLYRELERVLANVHGVSMPIVLKGMALASTNYAEIAHRPMSDIDLLVPRADVARWSERLAELGYRRTSPEMASGLSEHVHYHVAFQGGTHDDVVIEVHWSLVGGTADSRAPAMDWFWGQTEAWRPPADVVSAEARALNPTAELLYLSAHAFLQHGSAHARLIWIYDVHRLLERRSHDIDWSELAETATRFEWNLAVDAALRRSVELFGTILPDEAKAHVASLKLGSTRSSTHLRSKSDATTTRAEMVWQELLCLDAPGRMRLAGAILLPDSSYMKWRYPKAGRLWPLGYPYRWAQVLVEGSSALARRLVC